MRCGGMCCIGLAGSSGRARDLWRCRRNAGFLGFARNDNLKTTSEMALSTTERSVLAFDEIAGEGFEGVGVFAEGLQGGEGVGY